MKLTIVCSLIAILTFGVYNSVQGQSRKSINLNENWIVSEAKSGTDIEKPIPSDLKNPGETWHKATMPQQVQDILYAKGLIPDPHFSTNPTKCTWVFEKD